MSQSLSLLLVHIVFATKGRTPLPASILPELHSYLATVARNQGCTCKGVGGMPDHVHLAIRLTRTLTVADLVEILKTSSSRWLKTKLRTPFTWQTGYAVFSVSPSALPTLLRYIADQEKHHHAQSFENEYKAFLRKHSIPFDETHL